MSRSGSAGVVLLENSSWLVVFFYFLGRVECSIALTIINTFLLNDCLFKIDGIHGCWMRAFLFGGAFESLKRKCVLLRASEADDLLSPVASDLADGSGCVLRRR